MWRIVKTHTADQAHSLICHVTIHQDILWFVVYQMVYIDVHCYTMHSGVLLCFITLISHLPLGEFLYICTLEKMKSTS